MLKDDRTEKCAFILSATGIPNRHVSSVHRLWRYFIITTSNELSVNGQAFHVVVNKSVALHERTLM